MAFIYRISVKPHVEGERGLPKQEVLSAIVNKHGLEGDYNIYRTEKKESSPNMAVLLLPLETILQLNKEGWPVKPGDLGENLTTSGISYPNFNLGDKFKIGTTLQIEISEPCTPCGNLKVLPYVGEERKAEFIAALFSKREGKTVQPNRRGWYARVICPGNICAGDTIVRV